MLILVCVFAVGIVVFHLLEQVAPIRSEYKSGVTRRGYFADVTSTIINGPVLSALTKIGAVYLVTCIPMQTKVMGEWAWAAQFALFFFVNDFARYWLHRLYHANEFLWRVHRVHHTIVQMDAMSVFRIHILEAVIKNCVIFLPFQLLGINETVIIVYSSWDILKGFWHHANLRTHVGKFNLFFNSAELHWWHHSTEERGQRSNYGSILSIWDRLFHTFYWPKGQWPGAIGVDGLADFPDDYLGQFSSIRYDDEHARQVFTEKTAQDAADEFAEPAQAVDPAQRELPEPA
jgi:sterol desaturase/sphingolipid hydroxylase (fatty acid hydroxylase superfamily)